MATVTKCERCGRVLYPDNTIWLEYSQTDGRYYLELPEGHVSQGAFPFGANCASNERNQTTYKGFTIRTTTEPWAIKYGNQVEFYRDQPDDTLKRAATLEDAKHLIDEIA